MFKSVFTLSLRTFSNTLKVSMSKSRSLKSVVQELEKFAPTSYAEKWDNVGLLIEPYKQRPITKILLTNDLTERVMLEAVAKSMDMIISYHPPIFAALKRITQSNWKERIVSICLSESIALYSPHTAWDAVPGGVNDWLAAALSSTGEMSPILPNPLIPDNGGSGRIFPTDSTLDQAITAVQKHIGLAVHVAFGAQHSGTTRIKRVAVCAGSGASLLKDVPADLYITGEMSHHELLDANHQNTTVILCNHSNSERGFLRVFQGKLREMLGGDCEVVLAEADKDPLTTYIRS